MQFASAVYLIISLTCVSVMKSEAEETLKLVHVIFRHGNRTPDKSAVYPKDPHMNYTYHPYGFGVLTNKGKENMHLLGKKLRKRYDDFLGPVYIPGSIDAVTTSLNRTKTSLKLVLAALFPPNDVESSRNQSIPYRILSFKSNVLLTVPIAFCPKYKVYLKQLEQTSIGKSFGRQFDELENYVLKHTGWKRNLRIYPVLTYSHLIAQDEFGLLLPDWTRYVYPNRLEEYSGNYFNYSSCTPELKQLSGGTLLKKIIHDSVSVQSRKTKMFLYSAHDSNVADILSAFNVFMLHSPGYGACVLIEVHKINNVLGIKIFYAVHINEEPKMLQVPGCDYFCPLAEIRKLLKSNIQVEEDPCRTNFKSKQEEL